MDGKKSVTISIRMTPEQHEQLLGMIEDIRQKTGIRVTKSSLIIKLIEMGHPQLESLYATEDFREAKLASSGSWLPKFLSGK